MKKFNNMTRPETTALIQARTGKIRLNDYLYSIGAEESRDCPCGEGPQTVQHVLLCRPEFDERSERMWEGRRETNLTRLLGTSEHAKKAAQFLIDTGQFPQFRHVKQASQENDTASDGNVTMGEAEDEDPW